MMNETQFNSVCVVGLGYIGLPTAAAFASRKVKVIGVDVNPVAVNTINEGRIHIVEPELDIVVHAVVSEGYLKATMRPEPADAFLIAVPTPFKNDHEPDCSYIESAANAIAPVLKKGNLVVLESTSPVGATEDLANWLAELRPDLSFPHQIGASADISIAYCPERVLPGRVMHELIENDRVIGGMTEKCSVQAAALYKIFVQGVCHTTNARTAEMCKLTENAYRDVNIAFANELSLICDRLDIDVWELIKLANRHPRVSILEPGPGVGGHCIAVDPWFIVSKTPEEAKLMHAARLVNDGKPSWVINKVEMAVKKYAEEKNIEVSMVKIGCFGLAFKPNIDDLRESPALHITEALSRRYPGQVIAIEPNIQELPMSLVKYDTALVSFDEGLTASNVVVMLVNHQEFLQEHGVTLSDKLVIDTKGVFGINNI